MSEINRITSTRGRPLLKTVLRVVYRTTRAVLKTVAMFA